MPLPDLSTVNLPLQINGFSCAETLESGSGTVDGASSTATRVFNVQYSEVIPFITSFLPTASIVNGVITFSQGQPFPWNTHLVAARGKFEGFGAIFPTGPGSAINYPLAKVTIDYVSNESVLNLGNSNVALIKRTESATVSGEMLELPKNSFKFAEGPMINVPIDQACGLIMPHMDYTVTEENVPTNKFSIGNFFAMLGKMNSVVFSGGAVTIIGSAIYLGTSVEHTGQISVFGVNGQQTILTHLWKLVHQFKVRRESWDKLYCPATATFQKITPTPYPVADIGSVLQPVP